MRLSGVDLFDQRNRVTCGLAGSIFGACDDVGALERDWNALLLDWRGHLVAHLVDAKLHLFGQAEVGKRQTLGRGDVLRLVASILLWRGDSFGVEALRRSNFLRRDCGGWCFLVSGFHLV